MKIIIHGGFFSESSTNLETKIAKQNALKAIVTKSYEYLETHTALETVVYAVEHLENEELFNAGYGSQVQSDGKIRMSAAIMDGVSKKFSGVLNIEDVQNPVRVAEKLFHVDDRVIGGEGALKFAREKGIPFFNPETDMRRKEYEERLGTYGVGTVGCVALDKDGNIAASTSTGGKGFEMPGRISDSATIAGNFANNDCGVSCTGVGEDIVSAGIAVKIATRVTDGFPIEKAFEKTFAELKEFEGYAGAIAIDKDGNMWHKDSHLMMVFASYDGEQTEVFN